MRVRDTYGFIYLRTHLLLTYLLTYLLEQHSDHEGAAEAGGLPDKVTVGVIAGK